MAQQTFEEQVPSLKGKVVNGMKVYPTSFYFSVDSIQQHCLDRQKVREAIQRARGSSSMSSEIMVALLRLQKELLEEKELDKELEECKEIARTILDENINLPIAKSDYNKLAQKFLNQLGEELEL